MHRSTVPFSERGGIIRGCLDLVSGHFPAFVFGGGVGALLPVFHFHDVTREDLEPKLAHLAENGYRTLTAAELAAYVRGILKAPARAVALCFDDAWASLATVAAPLLKKHGLTAITYAIPARMAEEPSADSPFVTWPQLADLHASGVVDVQSHTLSHSMIFCSDVPTGFVEPSYAATPLLNRPQLAPPPSLRFLTLGDLGAPLYVARSRMSDAHRVEVPIDARARCVNLVAREGGEAFFTQTDWRDRLRAAAGPANPAPAERDDDRERAIDDELAESRDVLNQRLNIRSVNHICLPWGIAERGMEARLKRLGYQSAVANRLPGVLAARPGDNPYWLKRLPNRYIFNLPGRGRRYFYGLLPRTAASS